MDFDINWFNQINSDMCPADKMELKSFLLHNAIGEFVLQF